MQKWLAAKEDSINIQPGVYELVAFEG